MTSQDLFTELVAQVRSGNEDAAAKLVQEYEPYIRRAARNRLRSSQLRRVLDSVDICQSVLSSLFDRTSRGQYALETPQQLQQLLVTMVRNKVTDAWRRYSVRILGDDGIDLGQQQTTEVSVEETICNKEIVELAKGRMNADDFDLFMARSNGREWSQLAEQYQCSADSLRKRLARSLQHITDELKGQL